MAELVADPKYIKLHGPRYEWSPEMHEVVLELLIQNGWDFSCIEDALYTDNCSSYVAGNCYNDGASLRYFWNYGIITKKVFYFLMNLVYTSVGSVELYQLFLTEHQKVSAYFLLGNQTISYFFPKEYWNQLDMAIRHLGYQQGIRDILKPYAADILQHNFFASDANLLKIERIIVAPWANMPHVKAVQQILQEVRFPPEQLHGNKTVHTNNQLVLTAW